MAKIQRSSPLRREDVDTTASASRIDETHHGERPENGLLDAISEIVQRGHGSLFNATEVRSVLDGWEPHSSLNYEYVFAWNPSFDPSSIEIDWDRMQLRILRKAVKNPLRVEKLRNGSRMTKAEQ